MGEGEKQKQKQKNKQDCEGKSNKDAGKKEETLPPTTVILKVDMHCDGCASKIVRCLRGFEGVESLKAESEIGKLTITGQVDPSKLREKLSQKMKKKVDLISPHPKKDNNSHNLNKPDDKKIKEPPVTTVVLKVGMHCQGCIERIRKTVLKTKGVHDMAIDKEKETVTVKGTMDPKVLVGNLTNRLKRKVEIVPPKKDKDKDKEGDKESAGDKGGKGGAKKKKGGGGGGEGEGGGGGNDDKKVEGGGGGGGGKGKMEQGKMDLLPHAMPYGYGYGYDYGYGGGYGYGYGGGCNCGALYMGQPHAPQLFSDENPNACSVM